MKLNCIAVDDEPLALGLVSAFIEQTPFLHLSGKFGNAIQALQTIHSGTIHLIFLDIQMPDLNGMELARILNRTNSEVQTRIIFTTAYNQFAIDGYKVEALDYLLKPFGYDEFLLAATKGKNYFKQISEQIVTDEGNEDPYIFVKSEYKLVRIDLESILFVESLKDYVKIHLVSPLNPVSSLTSLKAIEEKLPASKFLRIHRSFIVAVNKIDTIAKNSIQIGRVEISVGELYKDSFRALLARWN